MSALTEKDYYHLNASINKALMGIEAPLKTKHARSVIIMTHKTKEAKSFWMVISRQPLMENRFTAWKFCHLLHKVLREGHENTLKHSQSHKKMIIEMGKLWGHLQDGVGICIQAYCKLLVTKLVFHEKNRIFPGSLIIDFADIIKYADRDVNVYFQLCVEIFDYLDDIIGLQLQIFSSINAYRMSSMTQQGQCRLAPLIPLIQDSNPLYDITVRLMFRLHDELPSDILSGHRNRFRTVFDKLKAFYENVRPLQYFADLIQVPHLPESAPNFKSKVDFGSYKPPVVFVQPEPPPTNLIDTSNDMADAASVQQEKVEELENCIIDREVTIERQQNEISDLKMKLDQLQETYRQEIFKIREENVAISNELASTKETCSNMRLIKDELELKLANTPTLIQKVTEEEEKAKLSVEKFTKLKTMYSQIRDEHITLLRQHSDSTKDLIKQRQQNSELISEIESMKKSFLESDKKIEELSKTNEELLLRIEDYEKQNLQILSLKSDLDQELQKIIINADTANINFTKEKKEFQSRIAELEVEKQKLIDTAENLRSKELKIRDEHEKVLSNKNTEINDLKEKLNSEITHLKNLNENINHSLETKQTLLLSTEQRNQDLLTKLETVEANNFELVERNTNIVKDLDNALKLTNILRNEKVLCEEKRLSDEKQISEYVINALEQICLSKLEDSVQQPIELIPKIIQEIETHMSDLSQSKRNNENPNSAENLKHALLICHAYTKLYDQSELLYKSTVEIEQGQDILNKTRLICDPIIKLLHILHSSSTDVESHVLTIKTLLSELDLLTKKLVNTFQPNVDLDDLVEQELKEMDSAIEDAALKIINLLSSAREKDNGIKLEVNEKILDSCTALMECIKVLIQKSRMLQEEIVASRRGTATIKEFYKRNSQWSEGLISASKSVAKAANYLVDAANTAVISENGKNFELIVAAQEIAACTAQLVVASKVKAPRDSQKLMDLTSASRNVSKATGAVVATVKDCNQYLEQSLDIDLYKMTPSQMKTMEMEIQVKVLELEQALQMQRLKLSSFRRKHYQNTEY